MSAFRRLAEEARSRIRSYDEFTLRISDALLLAADLEDAARNDLEGRYCGRLPLGVDYEDLSPSQIAYRCGECRSCRLREVLARIQEMNQPLP